MISVQSLLQQLSGNRIIGLLVVTFLLASCGGTDRAVDRSPRPKSTTKSTNTKTTAVKNKSKVKEVEWTEAKDEKKPPIKVKKPMRIGDIEVIKESSYDLTYFIPFDASNYNNSANASDRFIQYYGGLLIATEILEKEGVDININVVDEKNRKFENVLPSTVSEDTDVMIGPYSRKNLKAAATYAKEKQIPLVSPWQASNKVAKDNPYYIQLRPSLDEHYYSIFENIKANHDDLETVFLIGRETNLKDIKRLKKLHKMSKDVWGPSKENHLQEFLTIQDSIDFGETAFDSVFVENQNNIVIVPNWSFEDEEFIYGALRRLSVEKGLTNMIVYGMPIMLESERINFDYYSSLKMRVARSKFVDERDGDVARFKRDFVTKYGALPTDDAYEGYDNLMFIGRNLKKYGKNFQYFLNKDDGYYLQAKYKVEPTKANSTDDDMKSINYFENKNVDIIEFKNNRFSRNID